jgi:hypothetical protein
MKKVLVAAMALSMIGCGSWPPGGGQPPKPPEPPHTEECQALLDQGLPWCHEADMTCGECVHNPSSDPRHCQKADACEPTEPPPLPEPQCPSFTDRGGTLRVQGDACDCWFGQQWVECPTEPPVASCGFPQGIPNEKFTLAPNPGTYGSAINAVMADITRCSVGSDCPITFGPDPWMALVCEKLCEAGLNCGRHINATPGGTDQISVKSGSFCDGQPHQNYKIYNYGGGKVIWAPAAKQDGWRVECVDGPVEPPPTGECVNPDPTGYGAEFTVHCGLGNGTMCDSTYKVVGRQYCEQVCSPIDPETCFTGRDKCPLRMEGDPEREICERQEIGEQAWWCDGQPIDPEENRARARCPSGNARTCTEDLETCGGPG